MIKFNSVLELNESARALLESSLGAVSIEAEISRMSMHPSGHWYFVLKDEKASIDAVMFRFANAKVSFVPKDGMKVLCEGKVTLYNATGKYQINLNSMKEAGLGGMDAAFNALCAKLESGGHIIRDINGSLRKKNTKPLPRFPKCVGIITSLGSAAFADICKRIESNGFFLSKFYCFDTLVQGANAVPSIINALKKADNLGLDALILARGGGSKEDLWCFNDESLAYAILELKTPIISAIGHEIDYSISDFVSDHRSITPTASIEDLLPRRHDLEQFIDMNYSKLQGLLNSALKAAQMRYNLACAGLSERGINAKIASFDLHIKTALNSTQTAINTKLAKHTHSVEKLSLALNAKKELIDVKRQSVSVYKDGKKVPLDSLVMMDQVMLKNEFSAKAAQILG